MSETLEFRAFKRPSQLHKEVFGLKLSKHGALNCLTTRVNHALKICKSNPMVMMSSSPILHEKFIYNEFTMHILSVICTTMGHFMYSGYSGCCGVLPMYIIILVPIHIVL